MNTSMEMVIVVAILILKSWKRSKAYPPNIFPNKKNPKKQKQKEKPKTKITTTKVRQCIWKTSFHKKKAGNHSLSSGYQWMNDHVIDMSQKRETISDWLPVLFCFVYRPNRDRHFPIWRFIRSYLNSKDHPNSIAFYNKQWSLKTSRNKSSNGITQINKNYTQSFIFLT